MDMRRVLTVFAVLLGVAPFGLAQWEQQNSGSDAQLRGLSVVSSKIAWASGTKGTVLLTVDSGKHWEKVGVAGAEGLDFRDIQAFDEKNAFVLSAGPGEQSRIYRTSDRGRHWQLQFTNKEPKAFYDCFAFWDKVHGIALSDSVEGKFPLLSTSDGKSWSSLKPRQLPAAMPNEGAFAASGTCVATFGKNDAWFVTGGPGARVFHSSDRGKAWTAAETPLQSGAASQGIFSVAFWSRQSGVVVGGDYKDPGNKNKNAAFTSDGGKTWELATKSPAGYRSAVAVIPGASPVLIAVGTSGSDFSLDAGKTWEPIDSLEYNAVSFAAANAGWAVGPNGRIAHFIKVPEKLIAGPSNQQ